MGVSSQDCTLATLRQRQKSPWYPLNRRLSGPQNQSGHSGEKIPIIAPAGELNSGCPAHSLVSILTRLPQLLLLYMH